MTRDVSHATRQRVVIIGAGGHGAELGVYLGDLVRGGWDGELLGYLDDAGATRSAAMQVFGALDAFAGLPAEFIQELSYVTAVGCNATRREIVSRLRDLYGERLTAWTLVHPGAYVGQDVEIGAGTCLAPGTIVTSRVRIGRHAILNVKSSVSHDCTIGDFVNVNPAATICGNVTVGEGAYIGAGATIKDRVSIGAWSVIGAGAVVVDDIPPHVTAVGVPARIIAHRPVSS